MCKFSYLFAFDFQNCYCDPAGQPSSTHQTWPQTTTSPTRGRTGSGLEDRAADNGFYTFPLGENIAAGFLSIQSVVIAWMW